MWNENKRHGDRLWALLNFLTMNFGRPVAGRPHINRDSMAHVERFIGGQGAVLFRMLFVDFLRETEFRSRLTLMHAPSQGNIDIPTRHRNTVDALNFCFENQIFIDRLLMGRANIIRDLGTPRLFYNLTLDNWRTLLRQDFGAITRMPMPLKYELTFDEWSDLVMSNPRYISFAPLVFRRDFLEIQEAEEDIEARARSGFGSLFPYD